MLELRIHPVGNPSADHVSVDTGAKSVGYRRRAWSLMDSGPPMAYLGPWESAPDLHLLCWDGPGVVLLSPIASPVRPNANVSDDNSKSG